MARPRAQFTVFAVAAMVLLSQPAAGELYEEDAPIPPGAKGQVLPLKGEVLPLKAEVLEIRGLAAGLSARIDPLQAALKDLGATVKGKEIKIDLAADVLFDFDKADLRPEAGPALQKVASVMKAYPKASATIEGHTDGRGGDQYNQKLSERRADSVRRWLVEAGVTTRMSSRGFGKARPIAPNAKPDGSDLPEGRQKNRRVEITVKTQ
ncbi:MAG: OmpA family protein [Rhizobiales bacterium]|nr:OmpA family protein [Hyphomicrobiales bacterium]